MFGTLVGTKRLNHLDRFFNFRDLCDDVLLSSQQLALCQAISVILLIKEGKNLVWALSASFLNMLLHTKNPTIKVALGILFSS